MAGCRHLMELLGSRTLSAPKLCQDLRNVLSVNVSVQIIRNRLNDRGPSAERHVTATPLTQQHRRIREQWSRAH